MKRDSGKADPGKREKINYLGVRLSKVQSRTKLGSLRRDFRNRTRRTGWYTCIWDLTGTTEV